MKQAGSQTQALDPVNGTAAADARLQHAALIALDWGTTSLRAYLYDAAGNVLATRASTAGIMNLPRSAEQGGFDAAFDDACGAWLAQAPGVPVIAAGMVGSAQGWVEAPYVDAPANADALVAGIAATGMLTAGSTCNPDFNLGQIGLITRWTPVKNLTFSADVTYVHLDQKYAGTITTSAGAIGKPVATYELKNQDTVQMLFRAQRNW